ncbi:MAG: dTDP-4-amino-4,6-dideoxygalactose transaminase [Bacteroidales bacterium]|jgi:dTDP-4-amino-4,6-dideoxygalactose transaminase
MIPFNKPFYSGGEIECILDAVRSGKISGNGIFTKKCHSFFENKYGFKKCLLTTSCTGALEMSAILAEIMPGDEVIVPSFSFVSTALAFVRQGAKIVFADSRKDHPGIDEDKIESLITPSTKAIIPVHYGGIACDMDKILALSAKYNLLVIEDAAHSIDSYYKERPLGSIGHLATFSFHETKNLNSGEGGLLVINDEQFIKRSEIIWEKGTNRSEFLKGEINKYEWVDIGSSFLPSEITAAYLWAQLNNIDRIQEKRKHIWNLYKLELTDWAENNRFQLPVVPSYATNNGHLFYIVFNNAEQRSYMIKELMKSNIHAVFHYQSLYKSKYYKDKYDGRQLYFSDHYSDCLLRLPFYFDLDDDDVKRICSVIQNAMHVKSL